MWKPIALIEYLGKKKKKKLKLKILKKIKIKKHSSNWVNVFSAFGQWLVGATLGLVRVFSFFYLFKNFSNFKKYTN